MIDEKLLKELSLMGVNEPTKLSEAIRLSIFVFQKLSASGIVLEEDDPYENIRDTTPNFYIHFHTRCNEGIKELEIHVDEYGIITSKVFLEYFWEITKEKERLTTDNQFEDTFWGFNNDLNKIIKFLK